MLKQIEKFIFPLLLISTFVVFPILFSFNDSSLTSYSNNETGNSKQPIVNQFFWSKSSSKELQDKEVRNEFDTTLPLYDPSRISIYPDAIQSLMKYYVKIPQPLQIASVSIDQASSKAYDAAFGPNNPPLPPSQRSRRPDGPAEEFFFKNFDEYKRLTLSQELISNGHMAAMNQFVALPRTVTEKDCNVKFSVQRVEPMFMAHYIDYFELDFQRQFGSVDVSAKRVRFLVGNLWRGEGKIQRKAYDKIREDLLTNKSVVKLTGCQYGDEPEKVIVYYDLQTDLFCIVGEKTNTFITGGIASLCDYIDVYYFKWLNKNKTFDQSIQFFDKPIQLDVDINSEGQLNPGVSPYEEFDIERDKGLPKGYDPANWWDPVQQKLIQEFLKSINKTPEWYHDNLEIGDDQRFDEASKIEAFTMLQLQAQQYVSDIRRPNKDKDLYPREAALDTDVRFKDFNPELIRNCKPTIIDVKALIDPQALISRPGNRMRTLEQQMDDISTNVKSQQVRVKEINKKAFNGEYNEDTLLHVINLLRIRPVDRPLVVALFQAKAIKKEVDLNCVIFLNTSEDFIF